MYATRFYTRQKKQQVSCIIYLPSNPSSYHTYFSQLAALTHSADVALGLSAGHSLRMTSGRSRWKLFSLPEQRHALPT